VTLPAAAYRDEVMAILVDVGYRTPDMSRERIDSLELARLVYEIEQRYGVELALEDEDLVAMSTVSGAAEVLHRVRSGSTEPG
jgi:acyl carrier protein